MLLRSGIATESAGRWLTIHPVAALGGIYPHALEPWAGVPQGVLSEAYAEIDRRWGFRVEAAPTHPGLIASGFPWWDSASHRNIMSQCDRVAARRRAG